MHFQILIFAVFYFFLLFAFPALADSTPYPGPNPTQLPGRIEIENYDNGGQNAGYFDTTARDDFGGFRKDDVDIGPLATASNGWALGKVAAGEWLAYHVEVQKTGLYDATIAGTSPIGNGAVHIEVDGINVTGPITISKTGGWETYAAFKSASFPLTAGPHLIKVVMQASGQYNLDFIDFTPVGVAPVPPATEAGCGPANGLPVFSVPILDLCEAGTPSTVIGEGPWSWTCTSDNNIVSSCSAPLSSSSSGSIPLQGKVFTVGQPNETSIAAAINEAGAGDTVSFPAGVYRITRTIALKPDLLLHADPGVVIENNSGNYAMSGANLNNSFIDGFTINGGPGFNISGGSNVKIVNNTVQNSSVSNGFATGHGMFISGVSNSLIDHNIIHNVAGDGIMAYNIFTTTISNNQIHDVAIDGIFVNFTDTMPHTGVVVDGNVLDNIGRIGIEMGQFDVTTPGGNVPPVIGLKVTNNTTKRMATRGALQGGWLVDIGLSIVVGQNGSGDDGSIIANNHTSVSSWGIEAMLPRGAVYNNNVQNETGIIIACSPGMQVHDNSIEASTPFLRDGGYCGGESVLTNRVNGIPTIGTGLGW